jgi:hypothetical protein
LAPNSSTTKMTSSEKVIPVMSTKDQTFKID